MASTPSYPVATAAVSCIDSNGNSMLRVYSTDGYNVTERVSTTSGWADGPLAQPGSAVSATSWANSSGIYVRVYCSSEDQTTEWCLDPGASGYYQGSYTPS